MSAETRPPDFHRASSAALGDRQLRANFRRAMDGLMAKRAAQFADPVEWRDLRALGAAIRQRTLARLPEHLVRLEARCLENGIAVHWAETTDEANAIVLEILQRHGATRVVKGKSMVSEEMHLNDFLERHGVESLNNQHLSKTVPMRGAPVATPDRVMESAEAVAIVREGIEHLIDRQREALILHEYKDHTYVEIASSLDITPEAAKSLLYRARNQLRHNLRPRLEAIA